MFGDILSTLFGTRHERTIRKIRPLVVRINALEPTYEKATDAELRAMTALFREKLEKGAGLDDVLPDAFAVVREAGRRALHMRHFDVQLIGGVVLHRGNIAEMKTGEGKTLVATLPAYLNALANKGVHIVTVNDYLAERDAEWMGRLYRFLGMEVGVIKHGLSNEQRRKSYAADITYGTNSEFGFDYLRDNMKLSVEHMVQRGHTYGIVDEVDSILIDEARTPLIISGAAEGDTSKYTEIDGVIPGLVIDIDYLLDEEARTVNLTDAGIDKIEARLKLTNLYLAENIETLHHVNQALRSHTLYKRDRDYAVIGGKVVIIDPNTGRLMQGRRWSDGLHQAIEAKENVELEEENETLATITYQKYYKKYEKLSGMTGTADTEATEFEKIYKLGVVQIPTNRSVTRKDYDDVVYLTEGEKFEAVCDEIAELVEKGRPVLVGTASVEKSELLHRLLTQRNVPHNVLNAKQHGKEAGIIAQAGRPGSVTISTNMAGRGTDILLGGNAEAMGRVDMGPWVPGAEALEDYDKRLAAASEKHKPQCEEDRAKVLTMGGLHVLGTERHDSRRIDNQLRGRAGRQGDPGSSRFFLSLEDDLLRIFGTDRLKGMMKGMGMEEGEPLEHPWLSKAVANAQSKVEGRNFGYRKNLLEYDEVLSQQRDAIYGIRSQVIRGQDTRKMVLDLADELLTSMCRSHLPVKGGPEDLDWKGLQDATRDLFKIDFGVTFDFVNARAPDDVATELLHKVEAWYSEKEQLIGGENLRYRERYFLLTVTDSLWKEHLQAMEHLRSGIGLRGYGQRNPLLEYKKEGFRMFQMLLDGQAQGVIQRLFENLAHERAYTEEEKVTMLADQARREHEAAAEAVRRANNLGGGGGAPTQPRPQPAARPVVIKASPKTEGQPVGRNDPCPCGSGKKYKKCHGVQDGAGAGAG